MIILSLFGSLPLQEICCKTLQDMGQGLKAVQAPRPIYILLLYLVGGFNPSEKY